MSRNINIKVIKKHPASDWPRAIAAKRGAFEKMKIRNLILIIFGLMTMLSCRHYIDREIMNYQYFDVPETGTVSKSILVALANEEYLQYGSRVAYVDLKGDTVIPFGKYAYFGTDTLEYYANVIEHPNDSTWGRQIAIDKNQNVLFDLVMFDNGPDYFHEGLTRVLRNGKMGYANKFGQVIVPCIYDYVKWFENGKAEVTFDAKEYLDLDKHRRVESDEWFEIDKTGEKIK